MASWLIHKNCLLLILRIGYDGWGGLWASTYVDSNQPTRAAFLVIAEAVPRAICVTSVLTIRACPLLLHHRRIVYDCLGGRMNNGI